MRKSGEELGRGENLKKKMLHIILITCDLKCPIVLWIGSNQYSIQQRLDVRPIFLLSNVRHLLEHFTIELVIVEFLKVFQHSSVMLAQI